MTGVSLILATLGRVAEPLRLIETLGHQTCREFELIIVDQNANDQLQPVVDRARALGIPVQHIRQAVPNLSIARNNGLAAATRRVVAFPDDDCWYEPDTLARVLDLMAQADSLSGVIIQWVETQSRLQPNHLVSYENWRRFREKEASSITLFFERELLSRLGGFDPEFGLNSWFGAGEETELIFRVLAEGVNIAYAPEARVHHHYGAPRQTTLAAAYGRARGRARGTGGIYAKHALEAWVILRGFLGPLLRAGTSLHHPHSAAIQLGTLHGRLEGYIRWRLRHGKHYA